MSEKNPVRAHLVNDQPIKLHSEHLIQMLENMSGKGLVPLTFLDRNDTESDRSYEQLLEGARTVATYLRNRGLQRGDKVVLLLLTSQHFVDAFFGTILAGGVPVACSPPMTFGDIKKYLANLQHILDNSQARFVIGFSRIRKVIGSVLAESSQIREFILAKEIVPERPLDPMLPSLDADAPAFIQYTSGSTGRPKGAVLTHRALLSNVYGISQGIAASPADISVSWLPLFHDMGLIGSLLSALYTGAHLYTMLPEVFVVRPASWLQYITKYRATIMTAPNFAYHLCANRVDEAEFAGLDLSSLRVAFNGAEPVDLKTLRLFNQRFRPVGYGASVDFPVYGMAENCLAATFPDLGRPVEMEALDREALEAERLVRPACADDDFPYQAVSVGKPLAGQEISIVNDQHQVLNEGQVGEILVKSPSLMSGYYQNEEATSEVIRDGWLHTGDLGFVRKGRLFITGRAKEMIIKRGRNYYPYDIERAASRVEGVRKGCLVAFSTPNGDSGTEDLVIVAETRETDEAQKQSLAQGIAAEVLATVGIRPDRTLLVPPRSIPKTSSGKLQRLLARQRYLDGSLVKTSTERWFTPVKTVVGSFIGNQRFRIRMRQSQYPG